MSTRCLLSHNYKITEILAPSLSTQAFSQVFELGFVDLGYQVRPLSHPHWLCEVITELPPLSLGERLVQALVDFRSQQLKSAPSYKILALGGLKNTPATSSHPDTLQPGEWGVDIVETEDEKAFLKLVNWDAMVAHRPTEEIFNVCYSG